ncbi:cob(I)yrinic acid a,c-diamide adenosyltransferase [Actinomarinicola tropica]|uniref:Cob(I)yrinic acid a,c-diamide adenosyltransferase n=1 Tax=Actinomarinicola tropica TaxID=2789776 RepID=A0A5Q2RFT0_9ACTN|nr:cob(I)yrinic acid a,c-diamide adenosyltransferase [Actinomarinicola tropica]QGG94563.1 cob(I)yrinic acid a,c-diamide adenosyltransferase [Actinomarinicola tropica]
MSDSPTSRSTEGTPTDAAPTEDPRPDGLRRAPSVVVVNTGNGKGKSSAAVGVMVRGVARGWKVGVVQFLKSGDWKTGEEKVGRQLGIDWCAIGEGFTWESENLSEDEAVAQQAWARSKEMIDGGEHHLVVLDEITYPMNWGWISTDEVVRTIAERPEHVNVVCTGRDAPQALVDVADTVTDMTEVKHAYQKGLRAKKGIDY